MKKILTMLSIGIILFSLSACGRAGKVSGENETQIGTVAEENEFSADFKENDDSKPDISVKIFKDRNGVLYECTGEDLVYTGQTPLELYVRIENNGSKPVRASLSLLTKSYLQPFVVEGASEETSGTTVVLKEEEQQDIHIYVVPVEIFVGQLSPIQFMVYASEIIDLERVSENPQTSIFQTMAVITVRPFKKSVERKGPTHDRNDVDGYPLLAEGANGIVVGIQTQAELGQWKSLMQTNQEECYLQKAESFGDSFSSSVYDSLYLGVYGNEKNVDTYIALVYVDGQLVKAFSKYEGHYQYSMEFGITTETARFVEIQKCAFESEGRHLVAAVIIPVEYKNEDSGEGISVEDVMEKHKYQIVASCERIVNFE